MANLRYNKFPQNGFINTLVLRRPPSKKVVDSTFSVIMSVMPGMSSATDLSLLRDARDAPKWPRCKLRASEGKHLPKKDGSESQVHVTILHGLVGRDLFKGTKSSYTVSGVPLDQSDVIQYVFFSYGHLWIYWKIKFDSNKQRSCLEASQALAHGPHGPLKQANNHRFQRVEDVEILKKIGNGIPWEKIGKSGGCLPCMKSKQVFKWVHLKYDQIWIQDGSTCQVVQLHPCSNVAASNPNALLNFLLSLSNLCFGCFKIVEVC